MSKTIRIPGRPDREIQSLGRFSGANWASSAAFVKDPSWIDEKKLYSRNGETSPVDHVCFIISVSSFVWMSWILMTSKNEKTKKKKQIGYQVVSSMFWRFGWRSPSSLWSFGIFSAKLESWHQVTQINGFKNRETTSDCNFHWSWNIISYVYIYIYIHIIY